MKRCRFDGLLKGFVGISFIATIISAFCLTATTASADTTATATASVTVSAACSLAATNTTPHTAIINPGVYQADIGITTLKATCNDPDGFAIYAIGYTDTTYGKTTLTANVGGQLSPSNDITTGTATSGTTSKWAMKLNATSPATYPITLDNGYGSYSVVPTNYTKVAHRTSATDAGTSATGSELTTTYAAYIASNQAAGTYSGKVKYTLVHPAEHVAPVPVSKNLYYAITGEENNYTLTISDSDITSGAVAGGPVNVNGYDSYISIPWYSSYRTQIKSVVVNGTVAPTSTAYWFYGFDNCNSWNLTGLRTDHVTNMSYMFYRAGYNATTFTLDLSSWDTSKVTSMNSMFYNAGRNATTWSVGNLSAWNTANVANMSNMFRYASYNTTTFNLDLSSWDTSNVMDMSNMFVYAGYNATAWSVGDLSTWNTANVENMSMMFGRAGYNATAWSVGDLSTWNTANVANMSGMFVEAGYNDTTTWSVGDLSSWNTSSVTKMSSMFAGAGRNATTWSVGDLSSWDTSSVTNMNNMFSHAGRNATTFSLDLSSWNTANVTNMTTMFQYAGYSATTWSVTIPQTNGASSNPISNTTANFYGQTTSVTATPDSGRAFTLAQ